MNSSFMRWLLDLDVIPTGAEGWHLAWDHPLPAWLWTLIVAACAALAAWSYSRLAGRRAGRIMLATARALILLLLVAVICGPTAELPRETVEKDWVLVLADRSASMTIADAEAPAGRVSRDGQLRALLEDQAPMFQGIAEGRELLWLGFHSGAFNLSASDAGDEPPDAPAPPVDLGEPAGQRTDLNTALEQSLQRAAARPISGIVVLSDGRTNDPPGRALVRRLQADHVPVFVVPLGSTDPLGDLAIRRIDTPRVAFIRDKVPVVVELDRLGTAGGELDAVVRLVDVGTNEELDRVELAAGDDRQQLTLVAEPALAGEATWQVVVETAEADLIPENNFKPFSIELIDRPLRVLYVDGYPRWEYRYVKNLLVREASIDSSVFLVSADRDFAQEGNQPITRLPRSPEEFARFDVIILGDVPGTFFSPDQLEMIREHVATRGAGLLWIAGERATPSSYVGAAAALADLLPMRGSLTIGPIGEPVTMRPTALADRLGVLRLVTGEGVGWPEELADPSYEWSQLYYAQRIEPGRLKPAAEPLAETAQRFGEVALPLVIHMRYGAGETIYVATDEVWRWRYGRGEMLPEQFWVQMIRMLGRQSLAASGASVALEVKPRRVDIGQPVRIDLRVLDAQLADELRSTLTAVIETEDGQGVAEIDLRRLDASEARFAATYLPDAPATMRVRMDDPALAGAAPDASFEVLRPDDELRRPETDHQLLADLAGATGGRLVDPAALGELPAMLPNRAVRTLNPLTERIWDTPLVFGLLLLALTAEWIGRRVLRLA